MLLEHICNFSHLDETAVILGLTHINVTHSITHRTGKTLETASLLCQMRVYIFLGTKLCLNVQILTFIAYFFPVFVCLYSVCPLPLLNPIIVAAAAI